MNKKITVKTLAGGTCYCILSGDDDIEKQFNLWYYGSENPSNGIYVRYDGEEVALVDYYHNEKISALKIVSIDDTDEPLLLKWTDDRI